MVKFTFGLMGQMLELTDCPDYWNVNFNFMEFWAKELSESFYSRSTYCGVRQVGSYYRFDILNFPVELYTTDGKIITLSRRGEINVGENNSR